MQEPFPGRQIRYCITLALSASLSFLLIPRKFSAGRTSGRAIFGGLGQRLTLCFLTQKRRSGRASPSSRRGELGVRAWAPGRICRRAAEPPEEPPPPPPRCPAALMGCGGGSLSGGPLGRVPAEGNLLSGTGGRPPAGRERGGGAGGRAGGGGGRGRWDGAMLGGRAQGGEKRGAGARRLAGSASFIPLVPPLRGGSVVTEPSPHTPGFQWRYGSNGAAAEWVMLIHWEFQRSAGLKLHGCLLVGGKVFR